MILTQACRGRGESHKLVVRGATPRPAPFQMTEGRGQMAEVELNTLVGGGTFLQSASTSGTSLASVSDHLILRSRWPLARLSARRARRVSCPANRRTNERALHNRRSADGTHSTSAPSGAGFPRQPERRRKRSRQDHPQGWFRQHKDRLNPVRAVSTAARFVVNAQPITSPRRAADATRERES